MDYTTLTSDMQTYMLRSDAPYVTKIPDLIRQGIIRVYNNAKDLGFEIITTFRNIPAGTFILNKPGNWLDTVSIQMYDANFNVYFLQLRSYEFCRTYWPFYQNATRARPKYYADHTANVNNNQLANTYGQFRWFFAPVSDATYNFDVIYRGIPLFNADNSTNFLTQRYPDLLLYSCLIEACLFLDNEEKRAKYQSMFDQELATINNINTNRSADRTIIRDNN
jgi:hypothetical protein